MKARFAVFLVVSGLCASAEAVIVLDDFTVPVFTDEIREFDESYGVGDLQGRRTSIFTAHFGVGAAGNLDIGTQTPGVATATLISAGDRDINGIIQAGFQIFYDPISTPTFDITQGGMNEAIIVDVLSLTGETVPRYISMEMISPNGTPRHELLIRDLAPTTEPFQLVFPFEDFVPRRGLPAIPPLDLERIGSVEFTVASNFLEFDGQVEQWELVLDRIWVGPAIPEPTTFVLVSLFAACCAPRVFRFVLRKGICHEKHGQLVLDDS